MGAIKFVGDNVFQAHDDYARLLAGAHRRRVTPIGAPALTRHLAFWNPSDPNGVARTDDEVDSASGEMGGSESEESDPPAISRHAQAADDCIAAVYRRLLALQKAKFGKPVVRDMHTNSATILHGVPSVVLFSTAMDERTGIARQAPKSPDSYRAIKIDFEWRGLRAALSFELHTEFFVLTTVLDASVSASARQLERRKKWYGTTFSAVYDDLTSLTEVDSLTLQDCKRIHKSLYYDIWTEFAKEVLWPMRGREKILGKKFVDFRGLILGTVQNGERIEVRPPFAVCRPEDGTGRERQPLCRIDEFDRLWKFVTCSQTKDTEFTLSRFLGSRAFYATALGSQTRVMLDGIGRPLCYLLYEDTLNNWQLGRLVHRVHRAGTARIAAIMHFQKLRRANRILAEVERDLERANAELADVNPAENAQGTESFRSSLRHLYRGVEAKLAGVAELNLNGTLEGRIERSRYYVNQFYSVTNALRIRRVSGFQRYDEFVNQRLGPVFQYIDALGRRYSRVQSDRSILLGRIQTYDSQYTNELIAHAQSIADLALSCVILPYYAGYIISKSWSPIISEKFVWMAAFWFGAIMLLLFYLPRVCSRLLNRKPPLVLFVSRKWARFTIALLTSIVAANLVHHGGSVLNKLLVTAGQSTAPETGAPPTRKPAGNEKTLGGRQGE